MDESLKIQQYQDQERSVLVNKQIEKLETILKSQNIEEPKYVSLLGSEFLDSLVSQEIQTIIEVQKAKKAKSLKQKHNYYNGRISDLSQSLKSLKPGTAVYDSYQTSIAWYNNQIAGLADLINE